MPIPETLKDQDPAAPTMQIGVFLGWHLNPGAVFTGDYLVAELEPFRKNVDAGFSKRKGGAKVHRIKEVKMIDGPLKFPVAEWRVIAEAASKHDALNWSKSDVEEDSSSEDESE